MSERPRIISDRKRLAEKYHSLRAGDIVCGILPLRPGEEQLLLDLLSRGVHMIPPPLAQLASRSKVLQAEILSPWMIPHTTVIYDQHQLLSCCSHYHAHAPGKVVVKQKGKNAGAGVLLYGTIEDVYNQAANGVLAFPFILQPYLDKAVDIRVIVLGDYRESYTRWNPHGFRNNLHCGGIAQACELHEEAARLCDEVMRRAEFPYGHLDILKDGQGRFFLSEISLRGGLNGAHIDTRAYRHRINEIERNLLDQLLARR